jgi:hypothetical protein
MENVICLINLLASEVRVILQSLHFFFCVGVSTKFKIYDVADELAGAPIKSQRVDQIMVRARTN